MEQEKRRNKREKRKRNKGFPYKSRIKDDKKGQISFFYFLMLGIVVLILALAFAPGIKQSVELAMSPAHMDCNNVSISDFQKAACIGTDLITFEYVGGLLFIALAIITGIVVVRIKAKNE